MTRIGELARLIRDGEATESQQREFAILCRKTAGTERRNDPDTRGVSATDGEDVGHWLRGDDGQLGKVERVFTLPDTEQEMRALHAQREQRDLTVTPLAVAITGGSAGGYTVAPDFWKNLQVALRMYGGMWNEFRLVRTDNGAPMSWATNNPTTVVGTLVTEDTQLAPSSAYTFGLGQMNAWTVVGPLTLASVQLEEDSAFNVQQFVGERLGEAIGRELAALAWSGTGASQPLGVTTALAAGSSISPGTGTGGGASGGGYLALAAANAVKNFAGSTTELIANTLSPATLLNMVIAIDPAYIPTARFVMNAAQACGLRGQVDANNRPLINLDDGLSQGGVGTVYGIPVIVDNACPNLTASTVGGPVLISGQHAMVRREVREVRIMRLVERFADFLTVGYLAYFRVDSRSNDLRGAVTVKMAAT
jgi:HK97 family phage major capsid protein